MTNTSEVQESAVHPEPPVQAVPAVTTGSSHAAVNSNPRPVVCCNPPMPDMGMIGARLGKR